MSVYSMLQQITAGEMAGWAIVVIIIFLSLVQISPIKWNPWDGIFGWIGKKTNGDTNRRMEKLEKHIREMWINHHRQTILTFARECRDGVKHSPDEWSNALNVAEEYEKYVKETA